MAWTIERIKELLLTNPIMLERSIVKIWENQTNDEQSSLTTHHNNGIGFNGTDAHILSSFAEWIMKSYRPEGQRLSDKQRALAMKKMPKYSRQLLMFCPK